MAKALGSGEAVDPVETRSLNSKGCVDPARDALKRYRIRSKDLAAEDEGVVEPIGDLDEDGHLDIAVYFSSSCGSHVGCLPYYLYLRNELAKCDRFVGAYDGDKPMLVARRSHKLHDIIVLLPGLYGETQTRLSFDGVRYLKVAERERTRADVGKPWKPWGNWTTFHPGVSAENN